MDCIATAADWIIIGLTAIGCFSAGFTAALAFLHHSDENIPADHPIYEDELL